MSQLRTDEIASSNGSGPVILPFGVNISAGYALTANGMTVTGVVTATAFSGDASGLTDLTGVNVPKTIAIGIIA
jgi:hypothetical protein